MRLIAYDIPPDYTDEYLHIGEDTMLKCVHVFSKVLIQVLDPKYLLAPNEDTKKLRVVNEVRGRPRMLGGVGCMH